MSQLIDLSKLPAPNVLEELDFETLLAERKQAFIALYPAHEQAFWESRLALESEPITKLLEENCYLQLLERQRINNAAKATMLAYATGSDLDQIGANYNVARLVIQAEDLSQNPPLERILESDSDFRLRIQLAFEGMATAGPRASYLFHALSSHSDVADVSVVSPQPAYVTVTVLSRTGQGVPSATVLNAVREKLNDDEIRPIADRVTVQAASITPYSVNAKLHLYRSPEYEPILAAARQSLNDYVNEKRRLGRDVTLSGIYAALHIEGVQRVELLSPSRDMILQPHQAGYCTGITLSMEISDDY